jgi:hypothetical protein
MAFGTETAPHRPWAVGSGPDEIEVDAFPGQPYLRVRDFFRPEAAEALLVELRDGLEYERVDYSGVTRLWRAARPVGDVYFGDWVRKPGWHSSEVAVEALRVFESAWFVDWLRRVTGCPAAYLRPPTPYRLDSGDRICLHDDMSDPEHTISVAYNLTKDWAVGEGGETVVGDVKAKVPLPTPADSPIDLEEWQLSGDPDVLLPLFNSIVLLRLDTRFAHGVQPITGTRSRYSITTIYGTDLGDFENG